MRIAKVSVFILISMTLIFICFSGCAGGNGLQESSGSGAFKMTVAWPEFYNGAGRGNEQAASIETKMIPNGTQIIDVSITGDGLTQAMTASITYPDTEILVENLPAGNKVALIRGLDSSSNLKVQRKESFEIEPGGTAESGQMPLGIAIKDGSSGPVFEPTYVETVPGTTLYFQNWCESERTCRISVKEADNDLVISGASQDLNGKWLFNDSSINIYGVCPGSIVGFSGAMTAKTPIVQTAQTKLIDLIPKVTNGINGVYLLIKSGSSYSNMVYKSNYSFGTTSSTWPYTYPNVQVYDWNTEKIRTHPFYYDSTRKDSVIKVVLNGTYGKVRVRGSATLEHASGNVHLYFYKGASSYGSPIWECTNGGSFDKTINYSQNEELFFACDPLGDMSSDWGCWAGVYFQAVP